MFVHRTDLFIYGPGVRKHSESPWVFWMTVASIEIHPDRRRGRGGFGILEATATSIHGPSLPEQLAPVVR